MITVGLVQINNSYSGQSYLPYSVGLLQAYAQKHLPNPSDYQFLIPVYSRISPDLAQQQLATADIVGFSAYVWNIRISLEIARTVKAKNPKTLIVFGGPQVPDKAEDFLRKYPFIDVAVHGEGEQIFTKILQNIADRAWESLGSLSFIRPDGRFCANPRMPRIEDLETIPSPYLSSVFDPLMKRDKDSRWIVVWETNRGCPFKCTYCDWGSATQSRVYEFDLDRILKETEWFAERKIPFIFCADANFGIKRRDYQIAAKVAEVRKSTGFPQTLSVQNTKNSTENSYKIQKLLTESGLQKSVTISFQSMDQDTLKNIKRDNISGEVFAELQKRFTQDRISTYSDIIIGLPGETYNSFADGVAQVIQGGQHNRIVFNNLSILPNAEMGDPEYQKAHGMETIENEVVYIRGSISREATEVAESQILVIATKTMPREEWVRTRAYAWMVSFLHFSKLLQIPLILIHEVFGTNYRELIELFSEGSHEKYPVLKEIKEFFVNKARAIQNADVEFCPSEEWLSMYWPADEYLLLKICSEGKLGQFYSESEKLLESFLSQHYDKLPPLLLQQSLNFSMQLFKFPQQSKDAQITLSYNIWEFYNSILIGQPIRLEQELVSYTIDRTSSTWNSWCDWAREVVWYGNKNAAYFYPVNGTKATKTDVGIAGHH